MRLSRERDRWLAALATVALMAAVTYAVSGVVFQTNDDNSIVSAACGGVTGSPYPGNGFTSYLYGSALCAAYRLLPGVPWHALWLSAVELLALAAILRSLFFICQQKKRSPLWGAAAFIALYLGLSVKFITRLQFTAVPGFCAAAFAALIWTLPQGKRSRRLACGVGFLLMAFALLLRLKGGLLALPVPLMAGLVKWRKGKEASRCAFAACAAILAFAALAWLGDGALYRANEPGWAEQAAFDEASAVLLDYHNTDASYALALRVTDWSPELCQCLRNWSVFIDPRFNTENLTALAAAIEAAQPAPSLFDLAYKTGSVLRRYAEFRWNALAYGALGLWAFICLFRKREGWNALLLAGLALSTLMVIAYFYGWLNRFPDRVAFAYAFPVYTLTLLLCLEDAPSQGRAFPTIIAIVALAALVSFLPSLEDRLVLPGSEREARNSLTLQANAYAADHADLIFVTDVTQGFDAFLAECAPVNLVDWGSAMIRSPMYRLKFERLGYPEGFTAHSLADENVRLLLTDEASLSRLTAYLSADIAPWQAVLEADEGAFRVYRLR